MKELKDLSPIGDVDAEMKELKALKADVDALTNKFTSLCKHLEITFKHDAGKVFTVGGIFLKS